MTASIENIPLILMLKDSARCVACYVLHNMEFYKPSHSMHTSCVNGSACGTMDRLMMKRFISMVESEQIDVNHVLWLVFRVLGQMHFRYINQ